MSSVHIKENHIEVLKTARYYTLGDYTSQTEEVVVVFHGYAQLAKYFIKKFESVVNEKRLVVAPEGLSKFYWQGMDGRVVASWMTKEDRENEIIDQQHYLDKLYQKLRNDFPNTKITLFGFSQGVATMMRWIHKSETLVFDKLILWAGGIPMDAMDTYMTTKLKGVKSTFVYGNQDQFIKKESVNKILSQLKAIGFCFDIQEFKGDHNVFDEPLIKLF